MDASTWTGLVAAQVAVVAAVFAASQARSARRQATAAEQEVADNRAERERDSATQGRIAAIDYHLAAKIYVQTLCSAAAAGDSRSVRRESEAAQSALLRAINTVSNPQLAKDIIDLWQQIRLLELIHYRLDGGADPDLLDDMREAVILANVVANGLTSKLGAPVWTDPPLKLSRDLHTHID